jgi:hypothetical protein
MGGRQPKEKITQAQGETQEDPVAKHEHTLNIAVDRLWRAKAWPPRNHVGVTAARSAEVMRAAST